MICSGKKIFSRSFQPYPTVWCIDEKFTFILNRAAIVIQTERIALAKGFKKKERKKNRKKRKKKEGDKNNKEEKREIEIKDGQQGFDGGEEEKKKIIRNRNDPVLEL